MDTLLSVSHVSYSYHTLSGETPALSDITFSVKKGNFYPLLVPAAVVNPRCFHCWPH